MGCKMGCEWFAAKDWANFDNAVQYETRQYENARSRGCGTVRKGDGTDVG